jgi:hypothetical protein
LQATVNSIQAALQATQNAVASGAAANTAANTAVNAALTKITNDILALQAALAAQVADAEAQAAAAAAAAAGSAAAQADLAVQLAAIRAQLESSVAGLQSELDALSGELTVLLQNSNVYSDNLMIDSAASLQGAYELGDKINVVNANVTFIVSAGMDMAKVQAVANRLITVTKNINYLSLDATLAAVTFDNLVAVRDIVISQSGSYKLPKLAAANNINLDGARYVDKVLSVEMPSLTSVISINTVSAIINGTVGSHSSGGSTHSSGNSAHSSGASGAHSSGSSVAAHSSGATIYTNETYQWLNVQKVTGGESALLFDYATNIDLGKLAVYHEAANTAKSLVIWAKKGADVNVSSLTSKSSTGTESAQFGLVIHGAKELVSSNLVKGTVETYNVATVNLSKFENPTNATVTNASSVVFGAAKQDLTLSSADLLTANVTFSATTAKSFTVTGSKATAVSVAGKVAAVSVSGGATAGATFTANTSEMTTLSVGGNYISAVVSSPKLGAVTAGGTKLAMLDLTSAAGSDVTYSSTAANGVLKTSGKFADVSVTAAGAKTVSVAGITEDLTINSANLTAAVSVSGQISNIFMDGGLTLNASSTTVASDNISVTGNLVTTVSLAGKANNITIDGADKLTSFTSTAVASGAVQVKNNPILASLTYAGTVTSGELGKFHVVNNVKLASLTATSLNALNELKVTGNTILSSISFPALVSSVTATGSVRNVEIHGNKLAATSIYYDTLDETNSTITSNNGLEDLKTFLTTFATTGTKNVKFDGAATLTTVAASTSTVTNSTAAFVLFDASNNRLSWLQ